MTPMKNHPPSVFQVGIRVLTTAPRSNLRRSNFSLPAMMVLVFVTPLGQSQEGKQHDSQAQTHQGPRPENQSSHSLPPLELFSPCQQTPDYRILITRRIKKLYSWKPYFPGRKSLFFFGAPPNPLVDADCRSAILPGNPNNWARLPRRLASRCDLNEDQT
jgi:hypothetical protein